MFSSNHTAQNALIASELSAIREGVTFVRTEIAALSQDLKGLRVEQGRHEEWIRRLETDHQEIRRKADKVEELDRRLTTAESKVSDISNWRTIEGAKWSGPQKVIALIGAIIPVALAFYGLFEWLTRAAR